MNDFEQTYAILVTSCIALNNSRVQWKEKLYNRAVTMVNNIFSSLADMQNIVEAELLYLEQDSAFSRPSAEKGYADAVTSYHYALDILKILKNEPEMYAKYCVPACARVISNSKSDVPKDAFHYALTSHRTRLQNNERASGIMDAEGTTLILRTENIAKALKQYIELQKQVLGL